MRFDLSGIPDETIANWQGIVDIMAEALNVPAGLIMRINKDEIEVFLSSKSDGNPYRPGDKEHLANSGLYCETVINTREKLLVPNALEDEKWKNNPDIKLNMISYMGFPIIGPDDSVFGTICVLDNKTNHFSKTYEKLVLKLRELIQSHLQLIHYSNLMEEHLKEIQDLRGLVPICSRCKAIRKSDGYWKTVEEYMSNHPHAMFTHTICEACYKKMEAEFER